jgi:hypothetical protein
MSGVDPRLDLIRTEPVDDSFPAVSAWLHRRAAEPERAPRRRRLRAGVAAALALAAACAVPVELQETLGLAATVRAPIPASDLQSIAARQRWTQYAVVATTPAPDGGSVARVASPDASAAELRGWAGELARAAGGRAGAVEAVRTHERHPAIVLAARLFAGGGRGADSDRRVMGLVNAVRELAPGSVVIVSPPGRRQTEPEVMVVPGTPGAPPGVLVGTTNVVRLVLLRRRADGTPDTVTLTIPPARLAGSDSARTAAIREALAARGIHNVQVEVSGGAIRVTPRP